MDYILRFLGICVYYFGIILYPFYLLFGAFRRKTVGPITNKLLLLSCKELAAKIRNQEVKSEEITLAYINRIKNVDKLLNAVVDDRFTEALQDAKNADQLCRDSNPRDLEIKYPLLGVPFTVKESCRVKGLSHVVGMVCRIGRKGNEDGEVVAKIRAAGAIPLLVSATPEFCFSWECRSLTHGICNNPYDTRLSPGGSSGGEGALNGAGASVFGIGSDLAGSIRGPAMFNGIFGHKPTGGLVSISGHFPHSNDEEFKFCLQLGPLTRFASDLPMLLEIMAGENAGKLELEKAVKAHDIKIYYFCENGRYNAICAKLSSEIQEPILRAVTFFKKQQFNVQRLSSVPGCPRFDDILEMSLSAMLHIDVLPNMLENPDNPQIQDNVIKEMAKILICRPKYAFLSLFLFAFQHFKGFMRKNKRIQYVKKLETFRIALEKILGKNGVLFFPTCNSTALRHTQSLTNLIPAMYTMIFNILGFPATHVPTGLNKDGLPLGFQVVAAPYQDKLCLTIAKEIDGKFGGWIAPS